MVLSDYRNCLWQFLSVSGFHLYSNFVRNTYKNASFNLFGHYFLYFVGDILGPNGD